MIYPYISGINYESVADGPGVRAAIFLSGCTHTCPGCHNPKTHDPCCGSRINELTINNIAHNIHVARFLSGITLTGGDPLYNIDQTYNFLYSLRNRVGEQWNTMSVWLYTGYTWEKLMKLYPAFENLRSLLSMIDVIVDGPFIQSQADKTLAFRGSTNQRLIDVQKSLQQGVPVLWNTET
jgi:anaerobic ribonucleoside-triphosphate reductase activating protein